MKTAKVLALLTGCALLIAGSRGALAQSPISLGDGSAFGKMSINATIAIQVTNNVIVTFKGATKDIIKLIVLAANGHGVITNTTPPSGAQLVLTNGEVVILLADGKTRWPGPATNFSNFVSFSTGQAIAQSKDTASSGSNVVSDATTTLEPLTLTIGDTSFEGFDINCLAEEKSTDVVNNTKGTETQTYSATLANGSGEGQVLLDNLGHHAPAVVVGTASIKGKSTTGL